MIGYNFQKGKDYKKLPKKDLSVFKDTFYFASIKYDGNMIYISKIAGRVRFFTSDWKEFRLPTIALKMSMMTYDNFILQGEFLYGGEGKLGHRRVCQGILTTERANFRKRLPCTADESKVKVKIFEYIDVSGLVTLKEDRRRTLNLIKGQIPEQFELVEERLITGEEAIRWSIKLRKEGWEGVMLCRPKSSLHWKTHSICRVNHVVKVKSRPTADLLCIDFLEGRGKCNGIGSLTLQDSKGRIVNVGSGLDYLPGTREGSQFVGKVIEIEYEQIMDTYTQPVFKAVREDKTEADID